MSRTISILGLWSVAIAFAQAPLPGPGGGGGSSATLPTATAAGQVLTATGAGTTYAAQAPGPTVTPHNGSYTLLAADNGNYISSNTTAAWTIPACGSAGFPARYWVGLTNIGGFPTQITATTSTSTYYGAFTGTALPIRYGATDYIICDGTNWLVQVSPSTAISGPLVTFGTIEAIDSSNTPQVVIDPNTGRITTGSQVIQVMTDSTNPFGTPDTQISRCATGGIICAGAGGLTPGDSDGGWKGDFYPVGAKTSVNGSTSGTAEFSQSFKGISDRKIIVYLSALLGTATYTYPNAFSHAPLCITTNGPACSVVTSVSTNSVTITGATSTGFVILEGY